MVMKTLYFIFMIFLFGTWKVHGGQKLISCRYASDASDDSNTLIYTFDETKLDKKIEELKLLALRKKLENERKIVKVVGKEVFEGTIHENHYDNGNDYSVSGDQINLPDVSIVQIVRKSVAEGKIKSGDVAFEAYQEEDTRSKCLSDEESISERLFVAMKKKCNFEQIKEDCYKVYQDAIEIACGKSEDNPSGGCQAGAMKEFSKLENGELKKENLTSKDIERWTKVRYELFQQALNLKQGENVPQAIPRRHAGYRYCARGIQHAHGSHCFDLYDSVFNQSLKKLVEAKCNPEAIDQYVAVFKKMMKSPKGPLQLFQNIRNHHIQARLCTLKIVEVADKLDRELKEATQRLSQRSDGSP